MKIAILTPTFHAYSGIDRVAQLQAEELAKKGHDVTVIALEASLKGENYKVVTLGMPKSAFWQRLYRLFFFLDKKGMDAYKLLKGYDKTIAHFYPMTMIACNAKKKYCVRYVYWDHGVNTTGLIDSIPQKIYMRLFRFFNNNSIMIADEAYSVSKYLSDELWKESKIRSKVAYNPIDTKRFNQKVKPGIIRKKYGLDGKKVVLYVGRIAPHKGIHYLIEAVREAQDRYPDIALLIVGKETFPGYSNRLRRQISSSGAKNVVFAGFIDDRKLPSYYASCDVYATGSQWEGFDLPAAEAQACGKPVVAFDIGSHREIVKYGILVKNFDIDGFSGSLLKIAGKNRKRP
ncbi:MAG TPA: glycosyltransferase family 4 protein [Candidatus Nanoarchaeia archaeon]|nr:glycosyltransferase family 4 protein [Candidatus Nanoarchaeia archaeon]